MSVGGVGGPGSGGEIYQRQKAEAPGDYQTYEQALSNWYAQLEKVPPNQQNQWIAQHPPPAITLSQYNDYYNDWDNAYNQELSNLAHHVPPLTPEEAEAQLNAWKQANPTPLPPDQSADQILSNIRDR
jgi:hypothetical protein